MNGRQLSLREDPTEFVVYNPYPCHTLPAFTFENIPDTGVLIVSIDPGIKNFAVRVERRYRTGYVETVYMNKIDFTQYGETSERTGTTRINPAILTSLTQFLRALLPYVREAQLIVIERQMGINYKSSRIFQHVLTFFLCSAPECLIMDVWPKLKGKMLDAPKGCKGADLKAWGIAKALQLLEWRNDKVGIEIILHHKGKAKTKADDLADTVIQVEALCKYCGWVTTSEVRSLDSVISHSPNAPNL